MKKQLFSVLSFLMLCIGMTAQTNLANYTFASSMGTYVPITGASTFVTTWDNQISASIPLGGNFTFGAATFTNCYISANGFITFGSAPTGTNYTPLSAGSYSGAISAYGQDANSSQVVGATPLISYMNIGGATGEFVVQYADHANYYGRASERLNFQIRLNLATGAINIVYGSWTAPASSIDGIVSHVGIRGNSTTWTTNVNSLTTLDVPAGTTCNWSNAVTSNANGSTMLFASGNTNIVPTNGLTFTWAPPAVTLAPVRTFSTVTAIGTTSATLTFTAPTGATQYNIQYRTPGSCSWTNFSGNPVTTNTPTLTGLTPSTVYQVRVQSSDGTNNAIWSHIPNASGAGNGYSATGTFSTLPTCPAITGLNTSTITGTTANFTWTPGGTETAWDVYYGTAPLAAPSASTVPTVTTAVNSYSATGLTSATQYTVYVRANCGSGDMSTWSAAKTFSTITTCTVPASLNTSTITGTTATFTWVAGTGTAWDVYYGAQPLSAPSLTTVPTATSSVNSYTATGLYSGTPYAVYVRNNCGGGDVSVWTPVRNFTTVTTCSVPTTFSVSAVTNSSATFSWTSAASAFDVYYGASPLTAPNATTVPTATTSATSYTATGLTPSMGYAVYVRAQCGAGDQSIWTVVRTFTTLCNATNIPYLMDFNSAPAPAVAACTATQTIGSGNNWYVTTATGAIPAGFNTSQALEFKYNSSLAANAWFYTQGLNLTAGVAYRLSYKYGNSGGTTYIEKLRVNYGTSPINTAMTNTLTDHPSITTSPNTTFVDFTPAVSGVYYIGFNIYSAIDRAYLDVDDILVDLAPTCFPATALTTTNTTTAATDLSWTAPAAGTPANYIWEVRTSGAAGSGLTGLAATGTVVAPATSVTVSGLTALTSYSAYVRTDCGAGDLSVWSSIKTFTTLANCPVPTALNTSTVMATSATFTWVAGGSETAWDVYYGTQPLTVPTATTPATATTSVASYTASVLTQTTAYSVYVRASCGAGNTSIWTAVTNFTTPATCPATSSVVVSAVTATSAVSTWTAGGAETSWLVKYSAPTMTAIAGPTPSYTMSGLTPSTSYSVQVKGICAAADSSLWTVVTTFTTPCLPPNVINPTNGTRCGTGTVTLSATADMGGSINWYAAPTGGTALATGTLYTTPSLTTTTNYYASAIGGLTTENVGRASASSSSGFLTTPDWGIQFSTTKQVLINSVTVYPVGTGSVTIAVVNSAGVQLMVSPSMAVTGTGTNTPVVLNLGFTVPQGTGYRMVLKAYSGISDMIRDGSGNVFPYTAASGALSVTAGWNGSATMASYYWFYNLNISTGCESARTMITASVTTAPAVTFNAPAPVCGGSGIATLSVTSNTSDYDSYIWTPATGLFTNAAATVPYTGTSASVVYVNTTAQGTLNYNVAANSSVSGCVTAATASVTILDAPTSITVAATPTAICAGSTVSLSVSANTVSVTLVNEGFNGASNSWTTINNSTGGTPANAAWTLQPSGYVLPGSTYTGTLVSNDNTQLYLTNSDQQGNGSKTRTILQSPAINTTNMATLNLNFYHFYKYWATGDSAIMVQVSTNGTTWTTIKDYKTAAVTVGAPGALAFENLSLNTYTNNPTLYVRFNYNSAWGYGWAIDNVKVSGASTSAYSYAWTAAPAGFTASTSTATDTPSASTVYSVVITNTNTSCSNSGSVSVTVNAIPTVTAGASSASVCAGTSATLTAGGATNYTWTAGGNASTEVVSPSASSVYTVTGSTSGCSNTATVSVDVTPNPAVTAVASQTLLCDDGSTGSSILTASTTATSYLWSDGAMTMTTSVTPTTTTVYTVTVTEMGCSTDAFVTVTVSNCTGVKEASSGNGISLYPNPTNSVVNISISSELSGTTSVEIYDAIGKLVITEKLTKDVTTVNTSKLEDGIYMFKIINNNQSVKVGRIIKQ